MTALTEQERHDELMRSLENVAKALSENQREVRQETTAYIRQDEVVRAISSRLQEHEQKEFDIWEKSMDFQQKVGQSVIVLNHEMGAVQGQLSIMLWLMGGTTLAVVAAAFKIIFFA